ncbi:poly [ADP-ribose] polymerase tankyrase-2-like [Cloeon dipterum]|uniref:poly [ADP-ribose] polymerase tankyrase-2-like n=1 Tax=Cloeon dipterum TaxID=197152 RepID=UPI00321F64E8
MRLFHGSPHADTIAREGFRKVKAKGGYFGKGIYFAEESSKSNYYALGGSADPCPVHETYLCGKCERKMLLCIVALGNQLETKEYNSDLAACVAKKGAKYHALKGEKSKHIKNTEYIIYDEKQAYPQFLILYHAVYSS